MKRLIGPAKAAALGIAFGFLLAVGTRIGEWLIPAPGTRIWVCVVSDTEDGSACRSIEQLMKKAAE